MKFLIFYFIISIQIVYGQDAQKSIIKSGITKSKEKSFYFEKDKNNNIIFAINKGMNGPITMISAFEYDTLNRETKSYYVHSNLGFYLSEKVYEKDNIKNYSYSSKSETTYPYDIESLNEINSREDFLEMKPIRELENGYRSLSSIEFLDSANNITKEIYISESGEPTSVNYYKYNSKNQQVFFHHETIGDEFWTWDIYTLYNYHDNKIKSFRISTSNGIKDTTEVYNYIYNEQNLLVSKNYYYKNIFKNRTEYFYNQNNLVIEELFYEGSETTLDARTVFKYNQEGNLKKKIEFDYRLPKKEQKEVFRPQPIFW